MKIILTILILILSHVQWTDPPIEPSPMAYGLCPLDMKKAIYHMGPGFDYKIVGDRLFVWQWEWLRLRY